MSNRSCAAGLAFLAFACAASPERALADPIIYTEQAIATGTLGASDFIDTLVTITVAADTTGVTQARPGLLTNTGQASLSLGGVSAGQFLDPMSAFAFSDPFGSTLGITDATDFADLLDTSQPRGFSYNLSSALPPVSGASLINAYLSFATSQGDLTLFLAGDSHFSATVESVPEPASLALLAGATALLILLHAASRRAVH